MDVNLVDTAGVHEEVGVDLHDGFYWTLSPDLVHDVLRHFTSNIKVVIIVIMIVNIILIITCSLLRG